MTSIGVPSISLIPSNDQVGQQFMSLRINAYHWQELPINDELIVKVEELAEKEKQPTLVADMPIFDCRLGQLIYDEEVDMG